jgi:hypothetical protein
MTLTMQEEFDWDAYYRDTRVLSPDARGAWFDCLYHQRISPIYGRISLPMNSYAGIFGTSPQTAKRILSEIGSLGVGEVVTEDNGKVTVTNRRMFRQWLDKEGNKNRQAAYRVRHAENGKGENNGKITNREKTPLVVVENKKNKKEKTTRTKVATSRIPDPFPLTEQMIEWATTNLPTLRLNEAHENFIEYWTNLPTAKAEKVDWMLTWKKGMKLALRWQEEADRNGKHRQSNSDGASQDSYKRITGNTQFV